MIKKLLSIILPRVNTIIILITAIIVISIQISSKKPDAQLPVDYFINGDKFTKFQLHDNIICVYYKNYNVSCVITK